MEDITGTVYVACGSSTNARLNEKVKQEGRGGIVMEMIKEDMLVADHTQDTVPKAMGVDLEDLQFFLGEVLVKATESGKGKNSEILCSLWNSNSKFELKVAATYFLSRVLNTHTLAETCVLLFKLKQKQVKGR